MCSTGALLVLCYSATSRVSELCVWAVVGGQAFSHAVALGDVDHDGDVELITASTDGGACVAPWPLLAPSRSLAQQLGPKHTSGVDGARDGGLRIWMA
jgi:hypothetical protein